MPAVRNAELLTLPEVARATGIPLPDLQRLRRDHDEEVPSVVVGDAKRYPEAALAVFRRLYQRTSDGGGSELKPQRAPVTPRRALFSLAAQRREQPTENGGGRPADDAVRRPAGRRGADNGDGATNGVSEQATAAGAPAGAPTQRAPSATEAAPPAAPETATRGEVVDPGPPSIFDEMAMALSQLSGDGRGVVAPAAPADEADGERGRRPSHASGAHERAAHGREHRPRPPQRDRRNDGFEARRHQGDGGERPAATTGSTSGSLAAAIERARAATAKTSAARDAAQSAALRASGGNGAAEGHQTDVAPPSAAAGWPFEAMDAGEPDAGAETGAGAAGDRAGGQQANRETTKGDGHAAVGEPPAPSRPTPPLYTLQQIHERTGIPYSSLSLLAASHAAEVPSAGERYSPAYPLAGLQAFCRLYAERNPGWEPLPLGPEPGWDDEAGLAARLTALEAAQSRWSDELAAALHGFAQPWSGEAEWEA